MPAGLSRLALLVAINTLAKNYPPDSWPPKSQSSPPMSPRSPSFFALCPAGATPRDASERRCSAESASSLAARARAERHDPRGQRRAPPPPAAAAAWALPKCSTTGRWRRLRWPAIERCCRHGLDSQTAAQRATTLPRPPLLLLVLSARRRSARRSCHRRCRRVHGAPWLAPHRRG